MERWWQAWVENTQIKGKIYIQEELLHSCWKLASLEESSATLTMNSASLWNHLPAGGTTLVYRRICPLSNVCVLYTGGFMKDDIRRGRIGASGECSLQTVTELTSNTVTYSVSLFVYEWTKNDPVIWLRREMEKCWKLALLSVKAYHYSHVLSITKSLQILHKINESGQK